MIFNGRAWPGPPVSGPHLRTEYEGDTLRANLGLPFPVNRYAPGWPDRAATATPAPLRVTCTGFFTP
jgi:hypothetical protein